MPTDAQIDADVLREEYAFLHSYGMPDDAIAAKFGISVEWMMRVVKGRSR